MMLSGLTCVKGRPARGAALVLVLGAVAILAVLAIELSHRANLDVSRAQRASRDAAFRRCFNSGLEIAKGLLAEKRKGAGYDYWGEGWEREVEEAIHEGERIKVQVADESGKLNILSASGLTGSDTGRARKSLARLFAYLKQAEPEREAQWKEAEVAVRKRLGIGAGADQKEGAPPPLYTLDGLREAGVQRELVFGGMDADASQIALCDVLTVFGDGRVNLNTAHPAVLYALDEEYDEALVEHIAQWRGGDGPVSGQQFRPFKSVKDLELVEGIVQRGTVEGKPAIIKNLVSKVQDQTKVESTFFSVRMIAQVDGRRREAWGFFDATRGNTQSGSGSGGIKLLAYEEIEP